MGTRVNTNMKGRLIAALILLMFAWCLAAQAAPDVVINPIAPITAHASDGGTGDPNSIFDIVGDDGKIDKNNGAISTDSGGSISTLITKYRTIAVGITGVLTITMMIFMILQFTKLGAAGDNEMNRKRAIMGILTTGIATALLGGATIVVGFFWNVLGK